MNTADGEGDGLENGDNPLLFGRVLDGNGGGHEIGWDEALGWRPAAPDEMLWLHRVALARVSTIGSKPNWAFPSRPPNS